MTDHLVLVASCEKSDTMKIQEENQGLSSHFVFQVEKDTILLYNVDDSLLMDVFFII